MLKFNPLTSQLDLVGAAYDPTTDSIHVLKDGDTMTGNLTFSASAVTPFTSYNTIDQVTNTEKVDATWASNIFSLFVRAAGSGTARTMRIGDTGGYLEFIPAAASGSPKFTYNRVTSTSGSLFRVTAAGLTGGAGVKQYGIKVDPTINQSSTASSTMLWINPTITAIGSGAHYLIQAQVGGTDKLLVDQTGKVDSFADTLRVRTSKTPTSATSTGNAGDIAWDANYMYVCVAADTWKRSALTTW